MSWIGREAYAPAHTASRANNPAHQFAFLDQSPLQGGQAEDIQRMDEIPPRKNAMETDVTTLKHASFGCPSFYRVAANLLLTMILTGLLSACANSGPPGCTGPVRQLNVGKWLPAPSDLAVPTTMGRSS